MRTTTISLAAVLIVVAIAGLGWLRTEQAGEPGAQALAEGRRLYEAHCASCHGFSLEGQDNWQRQLPSGRLPAPPHDASGHTWHHGEQILFRITKYGAAAVVGQGYESDMPGFADVLSDHEIRAVLAYIRSTWPQRERDYQRAMTRRETGLD